MLSPFPGFGKSRGCVFYFQGFPNPVKKKQDFFVLHPGIIGEIPGLGYPWFGNNRYLSWYHLKCVLIFILVLGDVLPSSTSFLCFQSDVGFLKVLLIE